ncbi:hypothetical protein [Pedobacter cryoconitis]|uniref:Uncharacterized protein n=1 Tax=Pedobacter cryoconitis TaxID=188932 RepID=A0A327STC5_9SPHI|nr:hypothetical protein [Pedobacter cryoconitis]RAJ28907.1 hypothetical protein LY11_03181 [Pedobacter cryoconitis]
MTLKRGRAAAYQIFDGLERGQVIILKNETPAPEILIQYGKDYIDQGGAIEFSGDYSKIRKVTSMEEIINIINNQI